MIIYENTKVGFCKDMFDSVIEEKIYNAVLEKMGRRTSASEVNSWINSLKDVQIVLSSDDIPKDVGVALEYNVPYTSKRVDVILSGIAESGNNSAIVIELKQWSEAGKVEGKDGIVSINMHGKKEVTHPSYQAWSYVSSIENYNEEVQDRPILLQPCAYLHNYYFRSDDPLLDPIYGEYLGRAPLFSKNDRQKLLDFIKKHIKYGDNKETLYLIDKSKLRPSKSLQDFLTGMIKGNEEFIMLDQQKVVYENVIANAKKVLNGNRNGKLVTIIKGGPGTGKSVLAVNLMVNLTNLGCVTKYVTKNQAPRSVYYNKLKGTKKQIDIKNMFSGSGAFCDTPKNTFDVLVVDEAHRLNEKSGLYSNVGENQIKEIIESSRYSVFFIDEHQRVTLKDIGTEAEIEKYALEAGATIEHAELDSQFRCNGSDGYIEWLNDVLQIEETANFDSTGDFNYDLRVFKDPNEMRREIARKNSVNNKSRLVAGYCWNWISSGKNKNDVYDIELPEFDFKMSWNLGSTDTWAIDEKSINEAGCIHTCQGLEFDYVGVIIGDDLRYEGGRVISDYTKRARTDSSLKGLGKLNAVEREEVADRIIRNTYRTLMSRGMKGCYLFCVDKELGEFLEYRISKTVL